MKEEDDGEEKEKWAKQPKSCFQLAGCLLKDDLQPTNVSLFDQPQQTRGIFSNSESPSIDHLH